MIDNRSLTIAVVGDVHDQWDAVGDRQALEILGVDLVLFVGDFGNEAVKLVQQVADLPFPKAVILGNHDAWYTASDWGRKKAPYDHAKEDRVQAQLEILGETHVGYGHLDLPEFQLSVVGARPFSWGGEKWKNEKFYGDRYGVHDFTESTALIEKNIAACQYETLIFLGHNGPTGLGSEPEDMCGRDWNPLGGDFGDPDFAQALAIARRQNKTIPLVTFGHMHHSLRHRKDRLRTQCQFSDETLYFNAARVPRIQTYNNGDRRHSFSVITLTQGRPTKAELVWVNPANQQQTRETLWSQPLSSLP
ncbi:TIGR04168 family protein [Picosynechococcus sp. NKBG042902]|uniref:TIGR04168 family protein n=1 Tax=Picosynechococcus sp. NKBG042902 TaxID=490193 RepID=UPI0004AACB0E|nr:TIGR04168 family protein [Picosynechococcus sp. NKBG042902]